MNSIGRKHLRLKRLQEIREIIERKHQRDLARKNETMQKVEARLEMLEKKKSKFLKRELTDIQGLNAAAVLSRYNYSETLSRHISHQNRDVRKAMEALERARQQLLEATKDRKVLERLCEIYYEREQYETRRSEQSLLDEIASNMHPGSNGEAV